MITPAYLRTMAAYNRWQNESLVTAASRLSDDERREDRGAFFGSIHATLSHLYWGDKMWLHRFTGSPKPRAASIAESVAECADWAELVGKRPVLDAEIAVWADGVTDAELEGDLSWFSESVGREVSMPRALLFTHFFNHQTHHRGQVHAMLTAAGERPEPTDMPFMPGI